MKSFGQVVKFLGLLTIVSIVVGSIFLLGKEDFDVGSAPLSPSFSNFAGKPIGNLYVFPKASESSMQCRCLSSLYSPVPIYIAEGLECVDSDFEPSWCFTQPGSCSDGKTVKNLDWQIRNSPVEWSYQACEGSRSNLDFSPDAFLPSSADGVEFHIGSKKFLNSVIVKKGAFLTSHHTFVPPLTISLEIRNMGPPECRSTPALTVSFLNPVYDKPSGLQFDLGINGSLAMLKSYGQPNFPQPFTAGWSDVWRKLEIRIFDFAKFPGNDPVYFAQYFLDGSSRQRKNLKEKPKPGHITIWALCEDVELKKFSIIPEIVLTEKEKALEDYLVKMKKSKSDNDKLFFDAKEQGFLETTTLDPDDDYGQHDDQISASDWILNTNDEEKAKEQLNLVKAKYARLQKGKIRNLQDMKREIELQKESPEKAKVHSISNEKTDKASSAKIVLNPKDHGKSKVSKQDVVEKLPKVSNFETAI